MRSRLPLGRCDIAARVDRQVQLHADGAVVVGGKRVGDAVALAVGDLGNQVKRRVVACRRPGNLKPAGFNPRFQRADLRAAGRGFGDEVVQAGDRSGGGLQASRVESGQGIGRTPDQVLQLPAGEVHVLPGLDLLGKHHVQPCLGLIHIRAGAVAGHQRLSRGIEAGGGADFLSLDQFELVSGQQGVKIGAAQAHPGVLYFQVQCLARVVDEVFSLIHGQGLLPPKQGLPQVQHGVGAGIPLRGGEFVAGQGVRPGGVEQVLRPAGRERDVWKELGLGLGEPFRGGLCGGSRRRQPGVSRDGCLVGFAQIQGLGRLKRYKGTGHCKDGAQPD